MSTSYSANQYESAFKSQKLQNWTVPKHFKERPSAAEGQTTFIATDRGHLLSSVRTKRGSAWPAFQGTWDLPRCFPPASINPTARSQEGQDRLRTWRQMKLSPNQTHEAPAGSQATNRTVNNVPQYWFGKPFILRYCSGVTADTPPKYCEYGSLQRNDLVKHRGIRSSVSTILHQSFYLKCRSFPCSLMCICTSALHQYSNLYEWIENQDPL
uniref:Protein Flattop n=1 Tax=Cyprinus carpio carpio TaxID=630221 RepID=A0A9J8BWJ4_CYPCA